MRTARMMVLALGPSRIGPGRWVEAGTPVGVSPEGGDEVCAPLTGVITQVYRCGDRLEIVLEHRREYEDLDD
ncbi:MAG: hypothetical protein U1B94_05075 [candidate division NC10 bacterium]|nr:hypothetical protein [candidate division NC10 bacterium]